MDISFICIDHQSLPRLTFSFIQRQNLPSSPVKITQPPQSWAILVKSQSELSILFGTFYTNTFHQLYRRVSLPSILWFSILIPSASKATFDTIIATAASNKTIVITVFNRTTPDYGNSISETYAYNFYPQAEFYTLNLDVIPEVQAETGLQSVPTILVYSAGADGASSLQQLTYAEAGDVAASLQEAIVGPAQPQE